ncbi:MAG TPA: hypothetical protein VNQ90_16145 [Chthoniobacteraceae bacterium]|nr:hypothetical protein [Chthoniobacteraceae bacterium]
MAITAPPPLPGPQGALAHNLLHNFLLTVLVVAFAIALSVPENQARAFLPPVVPTASEQGLARAVVSEKGKEPFLANAPGRFRFFILPSVSNRESPASS